MQISVKKHFIGLAEDTYVIDFQCTMYIQELAYLLPTNDI